MDHLTGSNLAYDPIADSVASNSPSIPGYSYSYDARESWSEGRRPGGKSEDASNGKAVSFKFPLIVLLLIACACLSDSLF